MKKIAIIVSLTILFLPLFSQDVLNVITSNESYLCVGVNLPKLNVIQTLLEDGNSYETIHAFEFDRHYDLGKPDIPLISKWILIPNGTKVNLAINAGIPEIVNNIALAPAQEPSFDESTNDSFFIDKTVYSSNKNYPEIFAKVDTVRNKRGQSCAILTIYPYQYNPVLKKLEIYNNLEVTVSYIGKAEGVSERLQNGTHYKQLKSMAINATDVLKAQGYTDDNSNSQDDSKSTFNPAEYVYLIITYDAFRAAADELAVWRNRLGVKTVVVSTSEISSTYNTDNISTRRNSIKSFINNAYSNWPMAPYYLLFIGDAEHIPPYYYQLNNQTYLENNNPVCTVSGESYPTDLNYVDINVPSDLLADIPGYGRIPVDNIEQATIFVKRVIDYESKKLSTSFYNSISLASYFEDKDNNKKEDGGYIQTCESIRNFTINTLGKNTERIYYALNNVDPQKFYSGSNLPLELKKPQFPWNGSASDISSAINAGRFLVIHRDHGDHSEWSNPIFYKWDVDALSNGNNRPVVFSINCKTGWFDNETDDEAFNQCIHRTTTPFTSESFAEAWVRHLTGGAVGIIAATRKTYTDFNNYMTLGLVDAIWPTFNYGEANDAFYRLGDILDHGKSFVTDISYLSNKRLYHYFGDPTMKVFTNYPSNFTNVSVSETSSSVTVNTGVSGCTVTLSSMLDNGSNYYQVAEGVQSKTFYNVVKPYCLTVTKNNYIPYFHKQNVYIQNHTFTSNVLIVGNNIYAGQNVTTSVPNGPVIIPNGKTVIVKDYQSVSLEAGFEVQLGGVIEIQ